MKFRLVCFGNPVVDIIHSRKGVFKRLGSPAANTAAAFVQLGGWAGIIGRIGKDKNGKFILSQLRRFHIGYARLRMDDKPTYSIDLYVTAKERRFTLGKLYYTLEKLAPADTKYLAKADAVYARLASKLFLKGAKLANNLGKNLYVGAHFYKGRPARQPSYDLRSFDVRAVIGDEEEMAAVRKYCKLLKTVPLITTSGASGSVAVVGEKKVYAPTFKVKAVDPTGAGDTFTAGYIFADLNGMDLYGSLSFANACGAIAVQRFGAQQKITPDKISQLLRQN